ncbi:hypothetical protein [Spirillospora sp. NPDC047279]|uniref:hypothetical protein n=1 Tax=Spirillospora sp. NPDC047279 TaxID=3155478 RepID=UPI0033FD161F
MGYLAAYAVSANTQRFWELSEELGYRPLDDAEVYAPGIDGTFTIGDTPQGGEFASRAFTLGRAGLPE